MKIEDFRKASDVVFDIEVLEDKLSRLPAENMYFNYRGKISLDDCQNPRFLPLTIPLEPEEVVKMMRKKWQAELEELYKELESI